jgi:diguanylate cyclase (GGDEF)-like protein
MTMHQAGHGGADRVADARRRLRRADRSRGSGRAEAARPELRRPERPAPPPPDRLAVERMSFGPGITGPTALALFYLIGGLLTLATLAAPGWTGVDAGAVLGVGAAAWASGLLVLFLRSRLSDTSCHVLVALGSLLIAAAMVAGRGGPATSAFASYFFFVAVYAALFFGPTAATAQISWAGTAHVLALLMVEADGVVSSTLVTFGGISATALVVGALVRQVRTAAATDPLTRLPNRRSFDEHLEMALARAERHGRPVSVLALDLDGFKAVNDVQGHAAGDRLLIEAGRSWSKTLRGGDLLARSGGDEFVVLLPDAGESIARRVAARLERRTPAPLGVSVGIAVNRPGEDADELLGRADTELYKDKARSR